MALARSSSRKRRTVASSPRIAAAWMLVVATSRCAARIASARSSVPVVWPESSGTQAASMKAVRGSVMASGGSDVWETLSRCAVHVHQRQNEGGRARTLALRTPLGGYRGPPEDGHDRPVASSHAPLALSRLRSVRDLVRADRCPGRRPCGRDGGV